MSLRQILVLLAWIGFNALVAYSVMWSAKEIRAIIKGESQNYNETVIHLTEGENK